MAKVDSNDEEEVRRIVDAFILDGRQDNALRYLPPMACISSLLSLIYL